MTAQSLGPSKVPIWRRFQIVDWVVCVVMLIGIYMIQLYVRPHCRSFRLNDDTIMYPKQEDTFPSYTVWIIAILCAVILVAISFFRPIGGHGTSWLLEVNATVLMILRASALGSLLTTPIRHYTGVLRPDFLERLRLNGAQPPADLSELVSYCEFDDNVSLRQGRQTFPSGHMTMSLAPSVVLVMYLVHRVGAFRKSSFALTMLFGSLLAPAMFCGLSRLRDNAHNPVDTAFATVVLGAFSGYLAFHISMVHVPLSVRRAQGIYSDYRPRMGFNEDDGTIVHPYYCDDASGMHAHGRPEVMSASQPFAQPRTDV